MKTILRIVASEQSSLEALHATTIKFLDIKILQHTV